MEIAVGACAIFQFFFFFFFFFFSLLFFLTPGLMPALVPAGGYRPLLGKDQARMVRSIDSGETVKSSARSI